MITETELIALLADLESFRVERTVSIRDTAKFSEAVCAFANDMHGSRLPGFLLIGADDQTGVPCGLTVTDELLRNLAGLTADGNIFCRHQLSRCRGAHSPRALAILRSWRSNHPTCHRFATRGGRGSAVGRVGALRTTRRSPF
jgi:ATP-dependent DNA helicase RecG